MQDQAIALPTLPPSVLRAARIGIPLAFVAAGALSFEGLFSLAMAVGWSKWLAWLLPIALDLYAAVSTAVWLNLPAGHEAAKPAARNARVSISLTIGGNAIYHLVATGTLHIGWPLVLAVSTLPPLVAERLLHLVALLPKPSPEAVPETEAALLVEPEAEQAVPQRSSGTAPKTASLSNPTPKQREIIAALREADDMTTSEIIAAKLGVTDSYVRQIKRKLNAAPTLVGA